MDWKTMAGRSRVVASCVMALLATAGCDEGDAVAAKSPGAKKSAPRPAKVRVDVAGEGTLHVTRSFFGEVRPTLEASLAAGASGAIERIEVREGDRVTRGQILVRIDTSLVDAQIKQAEAQIQQIAEQ
ncbi:MAG: biotin/lipoyl-binding protein, partial [Myxococcota bacterium]